jgi:4-amino-4-deoxy-L-arabinose transferase-like glycosyltransferase
LKAVKVLILVFTAYALFWNLGAKPLAEWDESRYGQIALEMLGSGDYVNYYYNGAPEFWTAKPPLDVWSILLSYKFFGFNEFALRLPAALAGAAALYFLFQFLNLYLTSNFVWAALALAVTTKALIGPHLSRSGDTDAFLLAALFAFLFFFTRFFRDERGCDLLWAGLALGLAFMAKDFALGFYLPVGLFFLIYKSGWKKFFKNKIACKFAVAGGVAFLVFPLVWSFTVMAYGNRDPHARFGGGNALEVMIVFDVLGRLTGAIDASRPTIDWAFLPRALDIRFGVWWSVLCFWGGFALLKNFGDLRRPLTGEPLVFRNSEVRREALGLSAAVSGFIFLMLFVSVVKLDWYVAPVLPFFCLFFFFGFEYVHGTHPSMARFLCAAGLVLAVYNQVRYVSLDPTDFPFRDFVEANRDRLAGAAEVRSTRRLRQNELLYLSWIHRPPIPQGEGPDGLPRLDCRNRVCVLDF